MKINKLNTLVILDVIQIFLTHTGLIQKHSMKVQLFTHVSRFGYKITAIVSYMG